MTTASPGVSPVTPTESWSRPSRVYPCMSVPVSVIVMPSWLTVGHPVTTVAVDGAVGWSAGVGVGFAVGVGGTGVGTAVGIVMEQPTSSTARSTRPNRAKPAIALSRFMDAARLPLITREANGPNAPLALSRSGTVPRSLARTLGRQHERRDPVQHVFEHGREPVAEARVGRPARRPAGARRARARAGRASRTGLTCRRAGSRGT